VDQLPQQPTPEWRLKQLVSDESHRNINRWNQKNFTQTVDDYLACERNYKNPLAYNDNSSLQSNILLNAKADSLRRNYFEANKGNYSKLADIRDTIFRFHNETNSWDKSLKKLLQTYINQTEPAALKELRKEHQELAKEIKQDWIRTIIITKDYNKLTDYLVKGNDLSLVTKYITSDNTIAPWYQNALKQESKSFTISTNKIIEKYKEHYTLSWPVTLKEMVVDQRFSNYVLSKIDPYAQQAWKELSIKPEDFKDFFAWYLSYISENYDNLGDAALQYSLSAILSSLDFGS
jgi:hypothetical protein